MPHHAHHIDPGLYGAVAFFLLGVLGSLHCLGMCGPLSSVLLRDQRSVFGGMAIYHGARVIAYSALGFGLHALGRSLDLMVPFPLVFSLTALALFIYTLGVSIPTPRSLTGLYRRLNGRIVAAHPRRRALALGLLTPFLPCGLLYGALTASLNAPHSATAALWMAAFAAGTIPLLALGQTGIHVLSRRITPARYALMLRLLALTALVTIVIFYLHHHGSFSKV